MRVIKNDLKNFEKRLQKIIENKTVNYVNRNRDMGFRRLDTECRETLKKLVSKNADGFFPISSEEYRLDVIKDLERKGYIELGKQGIVPNGFQGGFNAIAMVTRDGKNYDELEEIHNNEIQSKNSSVTYNYNNDFSGSNIEKSNVMVGNVNSTQEITITNELVDEIIKTITSKIEEYGLSVEDKQELKDLIEDLKEKQQKKPNLIKRALKSLWDFAKDVGCGVLVSYLTYKCEF